MSDELGDKLGVILEEHGYGDVDVSIQRFGERRKAEIWLTPTAGGDPR